MAWHVLENMAHITECNIHNVIMEVISLWLITATSVLHTVLCVMSDVLIKLSSEQHVNFSKMMMVSYTNLTIAHLDRDFSYSYYLDMQSQGGHNVRANYLCLMPR